MSALYPKGCDHMLGKATQVDLLADTLKILFYAGTYVNTREFVADLTAGNIVARSGALAGVTLTNGVFDANDLTLAAVSGSPFSIVTLFKDTGADASSVLIASFDIATFTPTGGDVSVVWNASGLFSIA